MKHSSLEECSAALQSLGWAVRLSRRTRRPVIGPGHYRRVLLALRNLYP